MGVIFGPPGKEMGVLLLVISFFSSEHARKEAQQTGAFALVCWYVCK